MKSRILLGCVLWVWAQSQALATEAPAPTIELKGIVSSSNPRALLEIRTRRAPDPVGAATLPDEKHNLLLAKGQRDGELEVVGIDESAGKVTIRYLGQTLELGLGSTPSPRTAVTSSSAPATPDNVEGVSLIGMQRVDLGQALLLYQIAAHRSVIRPASLAGDLELDLQSKGTGAGMEAAQVIEQALAEKRINVQLDGDKFAIVSGRGADAEKITRELGKAHELAAAIENTRQAYTKAHAAGQPSGSLPEPPSQEEMLPAGVIVFTRIDLSEVLHIYGELTDRTMIRAFPLPAPPISFQNYTPLTREESIYALTAVLALNGVSVAAADEHLLLVVPSVQEGKIAALLSQKGPLDYSSLTNTVPSRSVNIPFGGLDMIATAYGQLAERKLEVGPSVPPIELGLTTQTALTTGEALRALDLLLGLHGLKVTSQEDSTTLRIVAQPGKNAD